MYHKNIHLCWKHCTSYIYIYIYIYIERERERERESHVEMENTEVWISQKYEEKQHTVAIANEQQRGLWTDHRFI